MKMRPIVLLFLAMSLSFSANYSFLIIPTVSSARLSFDSASALGVSASDPAIVQNFLNNITIRGDLNLTGSSVVNLVGVSSAIPVNVYLYGSVFVNDNATLVLNHARLYLMGATKPYDRNITLSSSSGHPQLNISDASIIAVTGFRSSRNSYSYGAAIYVYDKSKVTALGLGFSRQTISTQGFDLGGPTKVECYGNSSVLLNNLRVESMFTYDKANVTVYGGTVGTRGHTSVYLGLYNSSEVNLYGVSFPNTLVSGNAYLIMSHCSELSTSIITSAGHSRVDLTNGTTVTGSSELSGGRIRAIPGINATGNSQVYLVLCTASAANYLSTVISVYDNASFVDKSSKINDGAILALGNSSVTLGSTPSPGGLQNIEIIGNDSSNVLISNCYISARPRPFTINLFDNSHLQFFSSSITSGYFVFSDNSAVYLSNATRISSSRIITQDDVNLTVADGCSIADSIEMRENSRLDLKSSAVSLIYCLDSSYASFVTGSVLGRLSVSANSSLHLVNSTIKELSLAESDVIGSLSGLTSFFENSTIAVSGARVTALNTTVNGLDFWFSGNSNVTISNSTLHNLSLQDRSVVTLRNATVYEGPYVLGNSTALVYGAVRVHCVDYFGNPLNGSVVTITTASSGTGIVGNGTADKNGWASFIFFSGMANATGSFQLGFSTVTGSFGGASTSKYVNLGFVNEDVTLSFPLPWWSSYILPIIILIGIVALLVFLNYAYKRVRAMRVRTRPGLKLV